jgi:membrane associated rhomboid family serine protease
MVFPLSDMDKTGSRPYGTILLIALNIAMFAVVQWKGPSFEAAYAATPWEITHGQDLPTPFSIDADGHVDRLDEHGEPRPGTRVVLQEPVPFPVGFTLLTAMFLHGSPLHLVGNMLFLWIFGDNVEEVLGSIRYVVVYLFCGLCGTIAQVAAAPNSLIPSLGASGAIAGVMGAYLVWFPYHRVRVLLIRFVLEVPALWVIGIWIVIQMIRVILSWAHVGDVVGVAYLAHVGGAIAGVLIGLIYRRRARRLGEPTWFSKVVG